MPRRVEQPLRGLPTDVKQGNKTQTVIRLTKYNKVNRRFYVKILHFVLIKKQRTTDKVFSMVV